MCLNYFVIIDVVKKVFFIAIIVLSLSGCISNSPKENIMKHIHSNCSEDIDVCTINLSEMTSFEWDKVFVKGIGPSEQDVVNILGSYYNKFCLGCGQLVFYKNGELVFVDTYYVISFDEDDWNLNFKTGENHYLNLRSDEANFKVKKVEKSHGDGYVLTQITVQNNEQ